MNDGKNVYSLLLFSATEITFAIVLIMLLECVPLPHAAYLPAM